MNGRWIIVGLLILFCWGCSSPPEPIAKENIQKLGANEEEGDLENLDMENLAEEENSEQSTTTHETTEQSREETVHIDGGIETKEEIATAVIKTEKHEENVATVKTESTTSTEETETSEENSAENHEKIKTETTEEVVKAETDKKVIDKKEEVKDDPEQAKKDLEEKKKKIILARLAKKVGVYKYSIAVAGGGSGEQILEIKQRTKHMWEIKSKIHIDVTIVFKLYDYKQNITELWNGMTLHAINNNTNDNGKIFKSKLVNKNNNLQGILNEKKASLPIPKLTGNCWNIGELYPFQEEITVLDVDTGNIKSHKISIVGKEKINIGGNMVAGTHIKFSDSKWEMWISRSGIPLKHVDEIEGRKVTFQLIAVE